jgi:hypothetical protein
VVLVVEVKVLTLVAEDMTAQPIEAVAVVVLETLQVFIQDKVVQELLFFVILEQHSEPLVEQ